MPKKVDIRAGRKFLDLMWEKRIYSDMEMKYEEIAPKIGVDGYRSCLRICKRFFGFTIGKFFKHCRVMEVKQYLTRDESQEMELLDVAHALGYPHRRYFNESFKEVTGITPREFLFFHKHFIHTTGMTLMEYQRLTEERYVPEDGNPTFLSNFLNQHAITINEIESL